MQAAWVLLVDDHEDGRELLREFLTMSGFAVVSCASGEEALDTVATKGAPSAVVTDLSLGAMSGVDLARSLRGRFADMPILAVTGHASFKDSEDLFRTVLVKPIALDALANAIRSAIA